MIPDLERVYRITAENMINAIDFAWEQLKNNQLDETSPDEIELIQKLSDMIVSYEYSSGRINVKYNDKEFIIRVEEV